MCKQNANKNAKVFTTSWNNVYSDGFMYGKSEKDEWTKRTTIDEPRLSEIIEEYKSLGFEVRLETPKFEDLDEDCRKCHGERIDKMKTVYVRKRK